MENWVFVLGVFVGAIVFYVIPNIVFLIMEHNVDTTEKNETRRLQESAYKSLHKIKDMP